VIEVAAGVFKDTCLQLLDRVRDENLEVVATRRGEPVARLVRPEGRFTISYGMVRGTVLWQGDILSFDLEEWGDLA
jgi:antitoxin (DNA-binding transcriptional repressor) of toxin-antitoxin stability system